eukprot:7101281-Prymnesium_polylepis.1
MLLPGARTGAGDEVRPIAARKIFDAIHALLVAFEREVRLQVGEAPHLDGPIERGARKRVGVLRRRGRRAAAG